MNEEEAKLVVGNDPAIINGIFKATITPWHITFKAKNYEEAHFGMKLSRP